MAGVLQKGPGAADEGRRLFDRLQPTLPIVLANLVSVGEVAVTYQRQPRTAAGAASPGRGHSRKAIAVPNRNTKQAYQGAFLSFNLNLNLPPPCTTGFLPPQQHAGHPT